MRQAYDYWQDQPGCSPTRRALRAATRDALPFGKGVATRTLNARASDQANAHEPQKDSRARSFSDEANPSCCPFAREEEKGATRSGMNGRTRRARRNQSIDTLHAPALGCSHCNYSWQTTTPEGSCDAASKSARAQRFHEGTPCCEPPNNSSPAHPQKRGREPEPGVLTRESYRLAVHIVKRHNRFTHCPDTRLLAKKSQRRACCWARRTAESSPFREQKEDETRRETTQDQPLRGAPRPEEEGSIITTETTLKLTAAH